MAELRITEYTDPACPFAWSAEPARRRLDWLYGEHLEWQVRMVGLAERGEDYGGGGSTPSRVAGRGEAYERVGFTPERLSGALAKLAHEYDMPMDPGLRPRMSGTLTACR